MKIKVAIEVGVSGVPCSIDCPHIIFAGNWSSCALFRFADHTRAHERGRSVQMIAFLLHLLSGGWWDSLATCFPATTPGYTDLWLPHRRRPLDMFKVLRDIYRPELLVDAIMAENRPFLRMLPRHDFTGEKK